jgi:hypothetical protein
MIYAEDESEISLILGSCERLTWKAVVDSEYNILRCLKGDLL